MDTRKVTLVATIAVIALLAVGIGYAYTAATSNSNNAATTEYVTIIQDNAGNTVGLQGAYKFAGDGVNIEWNTEDAYHDATTGDTTYTFNSPAALVTPPITNYKMIQVGDSFKVLTQKTINNPTGTDTINIAINHNGFKNNAVAGGQTVTFFLKVVIENGETDIIKYYKLSTPESGDPVFEECNNTGALVTDPTNTFALTGTADTTYNIFEYPEVTVTVFYGYAGNMVINHDYGAQPAGPDAVILNGASLEFKYDSQA